MMEEIKSGDLLGYVNRTTSFSDNEIFYLFSQVVDAVEFLHQKKIAHRDLKLENFLITDTKKLKIIDFGFSLFVPDTGRVTQTSGTLHYASPELILGLAHDPYKSDVWAMGVILYTFMYHRLPFRSDDNEVLKKRIKDGSYTLPRVEPPMKDDLIILLDSMLALDPDKRCGLAEIKSSQWYTGHLSATIPQDLTPRSEGDGAKEDGTKEEKSSIYDKLKFALSIPK